MLKIAAPAVFSRRAATKVTDAGEAVKAQEEETRLLSKLRQQILILHLSVPDLAGDTVAWALFDGAAPEDALQMQSGDQETPPYKSVLAAMRDGWFVMQVPTLPYYAYGHEHETGHLPYEYVLERKVEAA